MLPAQSDIICCASYISARASASLGSFCSFLMAFSLRDTMVPMSMTGAATLSNTVGPLANALSPWGCVQFLSFAQYADISRLTITLSILMQ